MCAFLQSHKLFHSRKVWNYTEIHWYQDEKKCKLQFQVKLWNKTTDTASVCHTFGPSIGRGVKRELWSTRKTWRWERLHSCRVHFCVCFLLSTKVQQTEISQTFLLGWTGRAVCIESCCSLCTVPLPRLVVPLWMDSFLSSQWTTSFGPKIIITIVEFSLHKTPSEWKLDVLLWTMHRMVLVCWGTVQDLWDFCSSESSSWVNDCVWVNEQHWWCTNYWEHCDEAMHDDDAGWMSHWKTLCLHWRLPRHYAVQERSQTPAQGV